MFFSFLKYLRRHKLKIIILAVVMMLLSVFGAITPLLGKVMIDYVIPNQNWNIFWIISLGYIGVSSLLQGIKIYQQYISLCMTNEVRASLSTTYIRDILRLPLSEIQKRQAGAQIFRSTSDIGSIVGLITTFFAGFTNNIMSLVVAIGIMFKLNWRVTAIFIVFVPFVFLLRLYISLKLRPLQKEYREHNEGVNAFLGQIFTGAKIIKIFGMEAHVSLKYLRLLRDNIRINFRIWKTRTILGKIQWLFESGVGSFLQWWIWFLVMIKYTTLGSAMAISWYFNLIVGPFMGLASSVQSIIGGMISGERISETLLAKKESLYDGKQLFMSEKGRVIKFQNVSFSYCNNNEVLKNLTFKLKPGTITVLVGPSGSGKTTIINLICALYSPSKGQIEIDNVSTNSLSVASLRNSIALVPQESYIFEATVMENIKYANQHSSDNDVFEAAQMACIHEKIMSLPKQYNTTLKKDQLDLSVGEQQRISIARAFLRKSSIILLDEAFSNIDIETECRIMDSLKRIKGNKTIVIISHRLKSIEFVDNIIAIKEGYIIESGSPAELIEKEGVFFEWFESSPGQHASSVV